MADTDARLRVIEERLERIERTLERETELHDRLERCEESRRELAEQARFLIDRLGETLKQPEGG